MAKTDQKNSASKYQIVIQEQLDDSWAEWFNNFILEFKTDDQGNPITVLTGRVIDQAALNGILTKIWNLNLTVISVKQIDEH